MPSSLLQNATSDHVKQEATNSSRGSTVPQAEVDNSYPVSTFSRGLQLPGSKPRFEPSHFVHVLSKRLVACRLKGSPSQRLIFAQPCLACVSFPGSCLDLPRTYFSIKKRPSTQPCAVPSFSSLLNLQASQWTWKSGSDRPSASTVRRRTQGPANHKSISF